MAVYHWLFESAALAGNIGYSALAVLYRRGGKFTCWTLKKNLKALNSGASVWIPWKKVSEKNKFFPWVPGGFQFFTPPSWRLLTSIVYFWNNFNIKTASTITPRPFFLLISLINLPLNIFSYWTGIYEFSIHILSALVGKLLRKTITMNYSMFPEKNQGLGRELAKRSSNKVNK